MSHPLRILHVIPDLDPASGGTTRSVLMMAKAQQAQGLDVRIVCSDREVLAREAVRGPALVTAPLLSRRFSVPGRQFQRRLVDSANWADLMHLHSVWNGVISLSAWIGRHCGKPMVLTPHGMLDADKLQRRRWLKMACWHAFERSNLAAMAGFHYLNARERDQARLLSDFRDRPHLEQANAVDCDDLSRRTAGIPSPLAPFRAQSPQARQLVFLGRLNPIKGLEMQLQLVADLAAEGIACELHWVGPDDDYWVGLQGQARRLGIASQLHWHGAMHGDERLAFLRDADLVLLTSHNDCNPMVAAETLSLGGVLLATDTCHLEAAADAGAAIVVPRDRHALRAAALLLLQDEGGRGQFRHAGIRYARSALSPSHFGRSMLAFYQEAISYHRQSRLHARFG